MFIIQKEKIMNINKLKRIAESGDTEAQYNLGACYYNGNGVEQDYEYLAIPYWTEKDQSYKQLIDDKIHEILFQTK